MSTSARVQIIGQWTLVYDTASSGVFRGAVCSVTQDEVAYRVDTALPSASDPGMTTDDWLFLALSEDRGDKLYAKAADGNAVVVLDTTMGMALVPPWLITSQKENIGRFQVDVGNTGFFDGREFRYFREFDIPTGSSWWIRVVVPANGILIRSQSIRIDEGQLRFRAWRDLTISATFAAPGTPADAHTNDAALCSGLFDQNNLPSAPAYTGLTDITESGAESTVSGGTASEAERIRTAGATAQQISVGVTTSDERGVGPATYYLELQSLGTSNAIGTYNLKFEERTGQA